MKKMAESQLWKMVLFSTVKNRSTHAVPYRL